MRFISVEWSEAEIRIWIYVDGPITEEIREDFDAGAITQVVADFPYPDRGDPRIYFDFIRCDFPEAPFINGEIVYGRKEA